MSDQIRLQTAPTGAILGIDMRGAHYRFHREAPWATHVEIALEAGPPERVALAEAEAGRRYECRTGGFALRLAYTPVDDGLAVTLTIRNTASVRRACRWLRLVTGLDTYMDRYPDWNTKLFPTTLHYEPTHFWGLLGSPDGRWLGLASPDRWDSFTLHYDGDGGHRIHTVTLDAINAVEPRPDRYAPAEPGFEPGAERAYRLFLLPLSGEDAIGPAVARRAQAPFVSWIEPAGRPGETARLVVHAPESEPLTVAAPHDPRIEFEPGPREAAAPGVFRQAVTMRLHPDYEGRTLPACATSGPRRTPFAASVQREWAWYVGCAAEHARRIRPPLATHVCEAAMPAFSLLAAERVEPSDDRRQYVCGFLEDGLFRVAFTPEGRALLRPDRIQNTACAMDLAREMFVVSRESRWLALAESLAGELLKHQGTDGALYTPKGVHYTGVCYPAKSLMDLAGLERDLAARARTPATRRRHQRQADALHRSIGRIADDLLRRGANIETEGDMTFEDGMIACSALQLAQWACASGDARFAEAAEALMRSHRCLEWRGPDARTNGGTLRFWESYWAVGWGNCLNTPHGWSAWTGLAWHNLYLATGNPDYLRRFRHTLAAVLTLIDGGTGDVHFCFAPDPTIRPDGGRGAPVSGERFLKAVQPGTWPEGGGETHEAIRLLVHTVLHSAYVWREEGEWRAMNASVTRSGRRVRITPASPLVHRIYVNRSASAPVRELALPPARSVARVLHPA